MLSQFNNIDISFEGGIFGFEHLDRFMLEAIEDTPFAYLKSVEDENVSFITTSPFHWYMNYELKLDEGLKNKLKLKHEEDTLVLGIVTIKNPSEASTINLLAPLIINIQDKIGLQHVFHEQTDYKTQSPLFIEPTSRGEE
ncbi:flagellar assembly protein FliW [Paenibacillus lentus]|uniref:Flagellar assembly factor FliW n=1 Tax=Paenibacillus lentus TaxID=1338368 RepID=A0A3Q8S466_9BACL|nr:flagellar assembly protein FliW [Paenibacillus lentus]AZK45911.1 flagellar assembly protein FliW [Paenibacillus lentus]